MPVELFTICSETNDIGNSTNCEISKGWHINLFGQLDSDIGIP